ncbi:MAG: ribonuclease P protein subunit [Thermoprotei archaeon]|nr:MAG: ribonuclease P protein subunit [Thermoprotei archaeon]RLE88746.1 MAG: ribonuclease P protein subunit [Thermoprotei archaeon]
MRITPRNILRHELIGLGVEVLESTHPGYVGISGRIIYETMKTLTIEDKEGRRKIVPKAVCTFKIILPDGRLLKVQGKELLGRPEDRIKKRIRMW